MWRGIGKLLDRGPSQQFSALENPPDEVPQRVLPFRRACWRPLTESGDGGLAGSKFSGLAALAPDESWPVCSHCHRPMQLFLQLDSKDLPGALPSPWGRGLLQFFYCTTQEPHCESDCFAWEPFTASSLLRVVGRRGPFQPLTTSPVAEAYPALRIVGWSADLDYPNADELEQLGTKLSDEEWEELGNLDFPRRGDKLGGWPAWVQGVEYPHCPDCGARMSLLFQINSQDHLPHTFGDLGRGHISYCRKHPRVLAFGWAGH